MSRRSSSLSIKDWSSADMPREKLMHKGSGSLTDAELIAILIGSGNREETAVSLSQRLLAAVSHNLMALGKLGLNELLAFKGIGEAKAVTILAAMELSRRRLASETLSRKRIQSSADAYALMRPFIGELAHEEFWIVYLNNANAVLAEKQLSKGGITGTMVDVRLVLKMALELHAVALILAHNHPSGTLKASAADKAITLKLKEAAAQLDIQVLDHIIVTEKAYFSFADAGLL